jgi:DNA-directed RNA polymerase sigma subunit (sigma70/sigma32)
MRTQADDHEDGFKLAEVGEVLGLSGERARQIERVAIEHARELLVERLGQATAADLARVAWRSPRITRR